MRRLKILIWHIHGSYLNALTHIEHDWILPVKPGRPVGYGGLGRTFDMPDWVSEVPAERVRDLDVDLVMYQTPENLTVDGPELLGTRRWSIPSIYLEHNTPKPDAVHTVHPAAGTNALLIHVTHFNRLMWDNGERPARVIEHSVVIDPDVRYVGTRRAGIVVANHMQRRPRITGFDLLETARERLPIDIAGMGTETYGGLGDIPYRDLHRRVAEYRFLFSPMRYTSLPLAVIEAMHIGMPVVALGTTELPSVIEDGVSGFISNDPDVLLERMEQLLEDLTLARHLGENARDVARQRFGFERFAHDWNDLFREAIALHKSRRPARVLGQASPNEPVQASAADKPVAAGAGRMSP